VKELYFTKATLAEKSQEISQSINQGRRGFLERFEPCRSALLILDMQEFFLQPDSHAFIPSSKAIIPGLVKLSQIYSDLNLPVIFTRHLNTLQDACNMATWWQDLLTEENPLSGISHFFDVSNGVVLIKTQYDAFFNTSLKELLQSLQVTQVIIGGVMTHLCCETTARSAFVQGFEVFFTIDGTATYTETYHRATLVNLAHGFATPVFVDEIVAKCKG
jgi:bifunctional isochorismate lyase/aryl carrier protein